MFASTLHPNICSVLGYILNTGNGVMTSAGAVIDARGLPGSVGTSMTCPSTQPSPWYGITSPPPATILLPAGAITIPSGWTVPAGTHLIGVGNGDVVNGTSTMTSGTIIKAASSFSGTMITMCSAACAGVSIENLSLDGQGQAINGILNAFATSASSLVGGSYVKNVNLFQIKGTGITVSAPNSGPYTNILFDTNDAVSSSTICMDLTASTLGVRGLTCNSSTAS
jgi:hypothetical protein